MHFGEIEDDRQTLFRAPKSRTPGSLNEAHERSSHMLNPSFFVSPFYRASPLSHLQHPRTPSFFPRSVEVKGESSDTDRLVQTSQFCSAEILLIRHALGI